MFERCSVFITERQLSECRRTRAYYAYFDAVRALLATRNIASKSHSSIKMLFGEHFVQTGIFERSDAKDFHKLFLLRQNSDYDADEETTEIDAIDAVETASEFLIQVEAYLRQTNFIP